jgi:hypothetical protein
LAIDFRPHTAGNRHVKCFKTPPAILFDNSLPKQVSTVGVADQYVGSRRRIVSLDSQPFFPNIPLCLGNSNATRTTVAVTRAFSAPTSTAVKDHLLGHTSSDGALFSGLMG